MSSEGGFDFGLVKRNALLESKGCHMPKHWKTGTTIAGIVYKVRSEKGSAGTPRSRPDLRSLAWV